MSDATFQNQSMADRVFSRPAARLMFREGPGFFGELAALMATAPFLSLAPRGDRHPVLVMPGFGGSDLSTEMLRLFLSSQGYRALPWRLGRNLGPAMPDLASRLSEMFENIYEQHGGQKVSLVGWSLGGVYARLLAHFYPDKIRNVITLGSPYRGSPRSTRVYPLVRNMVEARLAQQSVSDLRQLAGTPVEGVGTTSIFSRNDAVVPWQIATEPVGPWTENVEVSAGHIGLGVSPAVMYAITDRLSKPEDEFTPFVRDGWKLAVYGPANIDVEVNSG